MTATEEHTAGVRGSGGGGCARRGGEPAGRTCCGRRHGGVVGRGTLVEPAALAALLTSGSHGYDIRRAILEMTGEAVDVDAGGLYRTLRRLEAEGFVTSAWHEEGAGPRRRDYDLTDHGRALARDWVLHLREREQLAGMLAALLEGGLDAGADDGQEER